MKFGRKYVCSLSGCVVFTESMLYSLPRNQVPEWAANYINYKGLKKLIKAAAETAKNGDKADLAGILITPMRAM
jgi:hypothetical protein